MTAQEKVQNTSTFFGGVNHILEMQTFCVPFKVKRISFRLAKYI